MDLNEAILSRRTIKDFQPDPVPNELLERVLSAGLWAQNHRLTQPWRFTILGPETRAALAEAFVQDQLRGVADPAAREPTAAEARQKVLGRPAIVVVTAAVSADAELQREDYAATCCAVQIIQLAAWAEGLGMLWSTGKIGRISSFPSLVGLDANREQLVGLLFFGFPARIPAALPRKPLAEVSRWLP